MKLNRGDGEFSMAKAFVGAVVQVDHRLLEIRGHALCIDCVTVIVSGHDDFAALEVLHRLVSAAMTVRQFESLRTACEGKQLMAKTDPEKGLICF
jgi:hypothetical protein